MVLCGGADQWVRAHWSNRALVDEFENAYWGFAEAERAENGEPSGDAVDAGDTTTGTTTGLHALYCRPDDQAFECVHAR